MRNSKQINKNKASFLSLLNKITSVFDTVSDLKNFKLWSYVNVDEDDIQLRNKIASENCKFLASFSKKRDINFNTFKEIANSIGEQYAMLSDDELKKQGGWKCTSNMQGQIEDHAL